MDGPCRRTTKFWCKGANKEDYGERVAGWRCFVAIENWKYSKLPGTTDKLNFPFFSVKVSNYGGLAPWASPQILVWSITIGKNGWDLRCRRRRGKRDPLVIWLTNTLQGFSLWVNEWRAVNVVVRGRTPQILGRPPPSAFALEGSPGKSIKFHFTVSKA